MPPPRPKPRDQWLPPILRMPGPDSTPGYSKAPRGLLVRPRVGCIFTANSISPSPPLRQRPSRYAIRAGRNLPDKEFRYLRTVIVTAAVHRGFSSELLKPLPLTFRHRAGVTPYMSAYALAGSCVFGKQSLGPFLCGPLRLTSARLGHPTGAPLLPKLRGELAEFLNEGSLVRLGALTPAHQCRSAVRALVASHAWLFLAPRLNSIVFGRPQTAPLLVRRLRGWTWQLHRHALPTLGRPLHGLDRLSAVTEYQPFVHRLRLSASA